MLRLPTAQVIAGLLLAVPCAPAQAPTAQAQRETTAAANAAGAVPQSGTVLQAHATAVLVDVVVTEHDSAVRGLHSNQFHVFEDGQEQAITFFDEHEPAPTTPTTQASAAQGAPEEPNTYSNIPSAPSSTAVNVLLLDGLNTPVLDQMRVRQAMLRYMLKIAPGTQLAVFTLALRLRMVQGFTANIGELEAAFKQRKAGPQPSPILDPESDAALDSALGDMATMGADSDALSTMQQFEADLAALETDQRVQMTLDALQQLARYLSAVPGRKNLIWFSGSFPLTIDPDMNLQDTLEDTRQYLPQLQETSRMLAAARVAVYPVDARGLMTLPSADISRNPSTNLVTGNSFSSSGRHGRRTQTTSTANMPNPGNDDAKFLQQTAAEQATMREIAAATGGKEYVNTNGLKEAVADAIENGSSYYTIGYVPSHKDFHGEFRKIQIKVDGSAARLAYRAGYYADPPDSTGPHALGQVSLILSATMHGAPPSTEILFKARVLPASDPAFKGTSFGTAPVGEMAANLKPPTTRYVVDYAIDPRGIQFKPDPKGSRTAQIELVLIAYNNEGERVNYLDRGFSLTISEERYQLTVAHGLPIRMELDLPPGPNYLRIAVQDLDTTRCGSLETAVVVP